MDDKKQARLRRARQTRAKINELKALRLSVHRSNLHIYAQIFDTKVGKVLVSASSVEADVRKELPNGGNAKAAVAVGRRIAEKAKAAGIEQVAFDRAGFRFHGVAAPKTSAIATVLFSRRRPVLDRRSRFIMTTSFHAPVPPAPAAWHRLLREPDIRFDHSLLSKRDFIGPCSTARIWASCSTDARRLGLARASAGL